MRSENTTSTDYQQGSPLARMGHDPSETTRWIPHMNQSLAILLGMLYTDGCVSPKGRNSWRIYFAVTSKKLIELFQECMVSTFNIARTRVRRGRTTDGLEKAVVDSKMIGSYLVSRFGTFRTLSYPGGIQTRARLPVDALLSSGYANDFLRTAFSCDGGVSLYTAKRKAQHGESIWLIRTVFLACAHQALRSDYLTLLRSFGLRPREVPGDGKIKIETEIDIRRFYEHIGFVDGVIITSHSKFWKGYTKQDVLKLLIESYGNPASIYRREQFMQR